MTPLVYLSIAWLTGIWLSRQLALSPYAWAAGALFTMLAAVLSRDRNTRFLFIFIAALALGGTRLTLAEPRINDTSLENYNDQRKVTLVGIVADEPDVRGSFVFYELDAESLTLQDTAGETLPVHGAARVRGPRFPVYSYGDRLLVRGKLETPPVPDEFNYRDYLALQGIRGQISGAQVERLSSGGGSAWKRAMFDIKHRAQVTIAQILPEPEASLLTGILLGNEGATQYHPVG